MLLVCETLRTTVLEDTKNVQPIVHRYEGKKYYLKTISSFSLSFFKSLKSAIIKEFYTVAVIPESITKMSIARMVFKRTQKVHIISTYTGHLS